MACQRWWLLAGVALLVGCNAVLGLDPRHLASDASASNGRSGGPPGADASVAETGTVDGWTSDPNLVDAAPDRKIADAEAGVTSEASGPCPNACTVGLTECVVGAVQTCQLGSDGCTHWVTTATCGANQTCAVGADGAAACTCTATECTRAGTTCESFQTLAICATDSDGCHYVMSTQPCIPPEFCSAGDAGTACRTMCGADACGPGQAQCVSGKLAPCTRGANGCYGYDTPVACGPRQTCTGDPGVAQCTCNTDAVCKRIGATCASSSVLVSCAQDANGCFYQATSTPCTNGACSGTAGTASCCMNACTAGKSCTSNTTLQSCATGSNGCTAITGTTTCANGACSGTAGNASCCTNACTAGLASCTSGTTLQMCATGTNGCTAMTSSNCSNGYVCERAITAYCTDPNWAAWPAPNNIVDWATGAPHLQTYLDNADGTVTDTVTGLMWQQTVPATMTLATALAYCPALSLGGHSDWRLPTVIELSSLVDRSVASPDPTINITAFPSTSPSFFWSATPVAGAPGQAWLVDFGSGDVLSSGIPTDQLNLRCMR